MTTIEGTVRPSRPSERRAVLVLLLLIPLLWSPLILLRVVLFQPFNIPSGSMIPTLLVGDYVFAAKYAYGYGPYSFPYSPLSRRWFASTPKRGDLVVFRSPKDNSVDFVKRVIGLPGDRVEMRQGRIILNDKLFDRVPRYKVSGGGICGAATGHWVETLSDGDAYEIYDCVGSGLYDDLDPVTVPAGHIFVLGDNRDNSVDSRSMVALGFVPMDNLIGRVTTIFWSVYPGSGEPRLERVFKRVR